MVLRHLRMKQHKILHVSLCMVLVVTIIMLTGCDSLEYEPFEYRVKELEARFNETQVVLDTKTLDDEEKSEIIDPINQYLEDVRIITGEDPEDGPDGGHWSLRFTTEDDQSLVFGVSYYQLPDDTLGIPVTLDGETIGHLEQEDWLGLLEAFDADAYVPEY